ncbi:phosphoglycolate phosphatase-like isoform X2 [Clavelina lepadiformis]|uniref:phosphoglycolate phosphatase-like isoform X2 n=1 Tax=Clavelina lepadiformis TaxID=159417 RepID=UPI0040436B88
MRSTLASLLSFLKNHSKLSAASIHTTKAYEATVLRQRNHPNEPIKLVIFDKDGTLTSFDSMWAPWCKEVANQLQQKTGFDVSNEAYRSFNYDPVTGKIGKGPLAENTHAHVHTDLASILSENYPFSYDEIYKIVFDVCKNLQSMKPVVEATCDVTPVFSALKDSNIKIAVCTSDNRKSTMHALEDLKISHFVDYVICGDDEHNTPKPAPDNVHFICTKLGVEEKHTAIIGDTPTDTEMGKRSGLGLVIGVLSGVGDKSDLIPEADVIVHNVEKSLPLILNPDLLTETSNGINNMGQN